MNVLVSFGVTPSQKVGVRENRWSCAFVLLQLGGA